MSEWWTYTLSDFLLFSPKTYERLLERYNAAVWPAQIAALLLGALILVLIRRPSPARSRVVAGLLAALWVWVAIAFQLRRYATINWAAKYFGWAFLLEAGLLLAIGLASSLLFGSARAAAVRAGTVLYLFALAIEPILGAAAKGPSRAEVFGVLPDPTAIGTLGLLAAARGRGRTLLMIVPALWCLTGGLTLLALKDAGFWIPPLLAVAAIVVAFADSRARGRASSEAPASVGA